MSESHLSSAASVRSGKTFRPWVGWLLLGVAFVGAAGAGVIINLLQARADECRRMQTELALVGADAQDLNGLEWETISRQKLSEESSEHLEKVQARMQERLRPLGLLGSSGLRLDEVTKSYRTYVLLIDQEFKLIAAAKIKEAEEFDEIKVDPASNTLERALQKTGDAYDKMAVRTLAQVRAGTFLVLFSAVGLIVLLAWQFNKRGRVEEVAAAEQRVLRQANESLESRVGERTADLAKANETLQAEISERKRAEWQLNIQYAISRVLAQSSTLKEASSRILQIVCENLNWEVGELYTVDGRAGVMRFDDMWSAPNAQIDAFIALSRQTTFARGIGLPGRVWASGKPIWVPDVGVDENFPRASAAKQAGLHGAFSFPILTGNEVSGVVGFFTREIREPDEDLLQSFANVGHQVGQFLERKRTDAELENIHKQLVEASRRGGMAEIATNVLHNVGNVLNSVNVSTGLIIESVRNSRASSLAKVVVLLGEHAHDLGAFITSDPKGKHVPAHLAQLSEHLTADQEAIVRELDSLRRNVEHIKEIVAMQQTYATFGGVKEMINVVNLVEDSMRMNEGALSRHRVEVIREFENVPPMNVEKNKILQILVNLVRNAKYACDESGRADKRLTVRVANGDGRVKILVIDNGVGISPENLTHIFSHGFTTWKNGHGFGLHSGALAAKEMGGSLTVRSDGSGQGAAFTLELPCENN
jgi:signal transduction histidine kinase